MMFPSLMPKGVEHVLNFPEYTSFNKMFPSLMPKGVEHPKKSHSVTSDPIMFPSLMPKGVEHLTSKQAKTRFSSNVSFVDAERR